MLLVKLQLISTINYTFSIYDIRKILRAAHPIKVEFKLSEDNCGGIYFYVLALTNKLVCVSSDGQRYFDSIVSLHYYFLPLLIFYFSQKLDYNAPVNHLFCNSVLYR